MGNKKHILRFNLNGLRGEFLIPKGVNQVVIIADGFPSTPIKKDFMRFLEDNGFASFYPRYYGTWESDGKFLEHSPVNDIVQLVDFLSSNREIEDLYNQKKVPFKFDKIHIVGVSFGGSVALELTKCDNVNKIVSLCPVIDYKSFANKKEGQSFKNLISFIKKGFGTAFCFDKKGVQKLSKGELVNPIEIPIKKFNKNEVLIVHGSQDSIVAVEEVKKFAKKNNIKFKELSNKNHLSLTRFDRKIFKTILTFLRNSGKQTNVINIANSLKKTFERRIKSILVYGSACKKVNDAKDIDMVIVLDVFDTKDIKIIKKEVLKYRRLGIIIQMQILYETNDLPIIPDLYSINTWGDTFIEVLKEGKVLFGYNPFKKIPKNTTNLRKKELLKKIQQYLYFFRNKFINSDLENQRYIFFKKTRRCFVDFLVIMERKDDLSTSLKDVNIKKSLKPLKLSKKQLSFAKKLFCLPLKSFNKISDERFCQNCLEIVSKLYYKANEHLRSSLKTEES